LAMRHEIPTLMQISPRMAGMVSESLHHAHNTRTRVHSMNILTRHVVQEWA